MKAIKAFHGTSELITEFKIKTRGKGYTDKNGKFWNDCYADSGETEFIYFSDNIDVCKTYGNIIMECELSLNNPFVLDANFSHYSSFGDTIRKAIQERIDTGLNDSIVIKNLRDALGRNNSDLVGNVFMVKPNQIKIN
jgi:hypothetical protein